MSITEALTTTPSSSIVQSPNISAISISSRSPLSTVIKSRRPKIIEEAIKNCCYNGGTGAPFTLAMVCTNYK